MDLLVICVSALIASGLTLFSGFGLETILTPVSALFFPVATAVAMTASLQSARYHCDGRVIIPSEITRVPVQEVRAALARDPAFASRWIAMLNREVRRLRLQCERLSLNKVQDRLFHLLETEGRNEKYPLGAGLQSLAADLGVTHEALYRCVASMEKKKLVFRNDGYLNLLASAGNQKS
jgi:CRP/FNR family transcriptional regulator, dissimilatory nitrate respiration regulator